MSFDTRALSLQSGHCISRPASGNMLQKYKIPLRLSLGLLLSLPIFKQVLVPKPYFKRPVQRGRRYFTEDFYAVRYLEESKKDTWINVTLNASVDLLQ